MTLATASSDSMNMENQKVGRVLWRPKEGAECEMNNFREKVNTEFGLKLGVCVES